MQRIVTEKLCAIVLAGALSACTADATSEETQQLYAKLEGLNLSTVDVALDERAVHVDGDMVFERDVLLAGGYDYLAGDDALIDKGFKSTGSPPVGKITNIKLVIQSVPLGLDAAVLGAASLWSTQTKVNIHPANSGTGGTITVKSVPFQQWGNGSNCSSNANACVSGFPSGGLAAKTIFIRSTLNEFGNAGQCNWTFHYLAAVMLHEFGHSVGFTHPTATQGTHIAGTGNCTRSAASCIANPGYGTVMKAVVQGPSPACEPAISTDLNLYSDDVTSAKKVYP